VTLGANKVATGHHADDQAETVIMRLIRGSGPQGLSGIPPVRNLGSDNCRQIIRPLIDTWRSDIMSYIRANKLKYRTDESNESPEYLRNRIRLELLPMLEKEYNPRIKRRLASAASALAAENDFIEAESSLIAGEVVVERKPGWVRFDASLLAAFHPALRKRVFLALTFSAKPDAGMLGSLHYEEADSIVRTGRGRLDLPGGLRLEISEGAGLISEVSKTGVKSRKTFEIAIGGATLLPEFGLKIKTTVMTEIKSPERLARMCSPSRQYFDLDALRMPLEVRLRRPGDAFRPLGARGGKKLKDFFIDKKVPRFLRDRVPLLISNGKIAWALGHAIDNAYRLRPGSTAALRVDYE
jgi:tRNA(Ile)-lysidine synthase